MFPFVNPIKFLISNQYEKVTMQYFIAKRIKEKNLYLIASEVLN